MSKDIMLLYNVFLSTKSKDLYIKLFILSKNNDGFFFAATYKFKHQATVTYSMQKWQLFRQLNTEKSIKHSIN